LKIAFLGTSAFACPSLRSLVKSHDVALVVTQPDRPAGRDGALRAPPVKGEAAGLGLSVVQPDRVNGPATLELLEEIAPNVIVVVAYGQLLKRPLFSLPPFGTINIHASLLPRYRGAAPINWAIIRGETATGVTTFLIDEGMDTGEILLQRATSIGKDETAGELHDRLAEMGGELIVDTLGRMTRGMLAPRSQEEEGVSLAPRLTREDGRVSWKKSAEEIHDQVRGMNPWPGAFAYIDEERIKLHRTVLTGIGCGDVLPGEIALRETGRLLVGTADQLLEVIELQRASRSRIDGREFLNGLRGEARFT
jgi:methionyl-tRNA formyltransferase